MRMKRLLNECDVERVRGEGGGGKRNKKEN